MERKCFVTGCENQPNHYPVIALIAMGYDWGDHDPIELTAPLPFCDHHMETFDPIEFFKENSAPAEDMSKAIVSQGLVPPDFTRAKLARWEEFGSPHWKKYLEGVVAFERGGRA